APEQPADKPAKPAEDSMPAPAGGSMGTGFLFGNSSFYYLNSNSSMTRGWKKENGMWYFYNTDGSMATGWLL
ncbi:choline-binding protein, partial [Streptococcus pseudopneumoniae]|nr:choline-binding protein [Streptococcus pseudopneumoniae]